MSKYEIVMPRMGEGIIEATIIRWLKNEGDRVSADEAILEIATDKVDSEIVSPGEGVLARQRFKEGDVAPVGAILAVVSAEGAEDEALPELNLVVPEPVASQGEVSSTVIEEATVERSARFFSPLVKNMARIENIPIAELETIRGTGAEGRITKSDLENYLADLRSETAVHQPKAGVEAPAKAAPEAVSSSGGDRVVEMDRMRKLIADHMVMSVHTSAHVTSIVEVNMSKVVRWRDRVKDDFQRREVEKITYTPIIFEVVAKALKEFPGINASVSGSQIIYRKNINIGMATVLPNGNLIVPVVKDADLKNLLGLTKTINDLAARARASKLHPEEIQGGTFSITNLGAFDTVIGTPIINQPQVAILAVGAIRKQPVVVESENGDSIGIAPMMYLSLSYDHRVVDGAMGGLFIKRVKALLENFDESMAV